MPLSVGRRAAPENKGVNMSVVNGSASEARTLAAELVDNERQLLETLVRMERSVKNLRQECPDRDMQAFWQMISALGQSLREILPATKEMEGRLNQYADVLERAMIQAKGAGVMYGAYACGTRPDYGISGGVLHYTSASGENSTMGLDTGSLKRAYRDSRSAEEAERIRAIGELVSLRNMLELEPEKSRGIQLAGLYGSLKGKHFGKEGYELHHMPPKAVFDCDINELPCILIPKGFHKKTRSYSGGRMRSSTGGSIFPDSTQEKREYRDALKDQIEEGNFSDAVRNEIYEIRDKFGQTLDGALDQFIDCMIRYYAERGVPKVKRAGTNT